MFLMNSSGILSGPQLLLVIPSPMHVGYFKVSNYNGLDQQYQQELEALCMTITMSTIPE